MQPAEFTLRQTQEILKVTIVKTSLKSEDTASLAVISSVAKPLHMLSDFNTSVESNLSCAVQDPCASNNCLWLEPRATSHIQHVCSNLSVSSTLSWQQSIRGLFGTVLRFSASRAVAGKYYFTLHIPLKPQGKSRASQQYIMSIDVDVKARACPRNSRVCIKNSALPGTCNRSAATTYTQGEELEVRVTHVRDIPRLLVPSRAVDASADMVLTFCIPHKQPPECNQILMIYQEEDGIFSATLPRLAHKGSHHITINHGNISGCSSNTTFVASCKAGHAANNRLECIDIVAGEWDHDYYNDCTDCGNQQ